MQTILVPFRDDATAQAALDLACRAAAARGACVEGLFIQTAPLVYASEGYRHRRIRDPACRRGAPARGRRASALRRAGARKRHRLHRGR